MRHPGPFLTIKTLQEQAFLIPDPTPITPLLSLIRPHRRRLARAVGVPMFDAHEILIPEGAPIRKRQGRRFHRAIDGPPHIDEPDPSLEQFGRFVGQVVAHARVGRGGGLIDVGALDGPALRIRAGAADGVVEDQDPVRGAGDTLEQGFLDFGVVVSLHGGVVSEVPLGGEADVGEGGEGVGVEGVGGFGAADVGDEGGSRVVAEVALWLAGGW